MTDDIDPLEKRDPSHDESWYADYNMPCEPFCERCVPLEPYLHYERYLRKAPVVESYQIQVNSGGGHPNSYGVDLVGNTTLYVKPSDGMPNGGTRVVHCEVAAWETIKLLGWPEMTGPTVLRYDFVSPVTNTATVASAQVYWHAKHSS